MTTGAPIYLVSACASPEQFVAAFRRYAERAGLFVPSAQPLPAGRRGRIALTLADGGVMVEGEAEVLQSSAKPQGLHGRAGMTLKFIDLDESSKTVLGELEKARLAMKPQPPSVAPRPTQVPAEPRAVPPRVGGRIDSANALAECVVIGDVAALREMGGNEAPKAGQKFVIPSIPARAKPPTNAPPPPAAPPPAEPAAVPAPVTDAASPPKPERRATSYGIPIVARAPAAPTAPPPAHEEVATKPERALSEGEPAMVVDKPPVDLPPPTPGPASTRQTTLGMPAIRPAATLPFGVPTHVGDSGAARAPQPPRRAPAPSTPPPPRPRIQTPVAPLPIARPPAMASSSPQIVPPVDELAAPAAVPASPAIAAATEAATPLATAFEDSDKAYVGAPPAGPGGLPPPSVAAAARSGGMRASEIMAAIPDEDWTMTPDAAQPTVLPPAAKEAPVVVAATTSAKGPPTGDWTMSADPSAAGGWTEPAKVQVAPEMRVPATGNPVFSIPEKALTAVAWEDKPTNIGAKIEIDPTLMEPLQPMPAEPDHAPSASGPQVAMPMVMPPVLPPVLPPSGSQPQMAAAPAASPYAIPTPAPFPAPPLLPPPLAPQLPTPMPGFAPAYAGTLATGVPAAPYPPQQMVSDGGSGFFQNSEPVAFAGDAFVAEPGARSARRRTVIIASAAAAAVVVVVVIVALLVGGKHSAAANGGKGSADPGKGPAKVVVAPAHSDVGSGSQGSAAVSPNGSAAAAVTTCKLEVTTVPAGAEISLGDKTALGTTPVTIELPCHVETKLDVKKPRYVSVVKAVTPSAPSAALDPIRLLHVMFAVKVTSTPPGATITVGGRVAGVTPTSIRLPALETSTIMIAKDGYAPDTEALKVRVNNLAHHVTLKKGVPKHH